MLSQFLRTHRSELIDRCKVKALRRPSRAPLQPGFLHGIPRFLDQLIETLQMEQGGAEAAAERMSGVSGASTPARSELGEAAALHGRELFLHGFTVEEVVHDYGDLCQAVTELSEERVGKITVNEFHTLNRCLDNAIADAVKEYTYARAILVEKRAVIVRERHGFFVHELRNLIHTATLAFSVVQSGKVTASGATGDVLDRSLKALSALVARSVIDVRTDGDAATAGIEVISLAKFIAMSHEAASLEANSRDCTLVASEVDPTLAIKVDRDLIFGALSNLLTNAFKFTRRGTRVELNAYANAERVLIAVSDHCGGIPEKVMAAMFVPFVQGGADRSGLGLGLAISRNYVEQCGGTLTCRNTPGKGCTFTIDLPRHSLQQVQKVGVT